MSQSRYLNEDEQAKIAPMIPRLNPNKTQHGKKLIENRILVTESGKKMLVTDAKLDQPTPMERDAYFQGFLDGFDNAVHV